MPKEADVPPQQGKPEKGAGEKNDEKKVEPFHLREKIEEMVDYGYPLTMSFPRKDRELADELKKSILTIYRLSIEIDRKYFKKTTTQNTSTSTRYTTNSLSRIRMRAGKIRAATKRHNACNTGCGRSAGNQTRSGTT